MKDDRPDNAIDIFGFCVRRLEESLKAPIRDDRDYAGIVKHFEMAYDQGYKSVLALLLATGDVEQSRSVKGVFRRAFELGWVSDERNVSAMIIDRNATAHSYDLDFAREVVSRIRDTYLLLLAGLLGVIKAEASRLS